MQRGAPRKSGGNKLLIVLLIVMGVLLAMVLAVALAAMLFIGNLKSGRITELLVPVPGIEHSESKTYAELEWAVTTPDGYEVAMKDLEGEVLFINFWATWCGPCRDEFPGIQRLHDELAPEGVKFMMISDEDYRVVTDFVVQYGYNVPQYTFTGDLPETFAHYGIPATYIVGRDGRIMVSHTGAAKWDSLQVKELLRGLLKKKE